MAGWPTVSDEAAGFRCQRKHIEMRRALRPDPARAAACREGSVLRAVDVDCGVSPQPMDCSRLLGGSADLEAERNDHGNSLALEETRVTVDDELGPELDIS